jgi:hypothetical protein
VAGGAAFLFSPPRKPEKRGVPHEPTEGIPAKLIAGDTWRWKRSVADHLASDGWALKYEFALEDGDILGVTAGTDPDDADAFLINVAVAVTGSLNLGSYRYREFIEKAGERFTISSGRISIEGVFQETKAERWVRIIRNAIESLISGKVQSVQVNGRARTMLDLESLRRMLKDAEAELEQEANAGRLGPQVAAVFQTPGFPRTYPMPPYPHGGSL